MNFSLDNFNKYLRFISYHKQFKISYLNLTNNTGPKTLINVKAMLFTDYYVFWQTAFPTVIIKNTIKFLYWLHNHNTFLYVNMSFNKTSNHMEEHITQVYNMTINITPVLVDDT